MNLRFPYAGKRVASICAAPGSGPIFAFTAGLLGSGECVVGVQTLQLVCGDLHLFCLLSILICHHLHLHPIVIIILLIIVLARGPWQLDHANIFVSQRLAGVRGSELFW